MTWKIVACIAIGCCVILTGAFVWLQVRKRDDAGQRRWVVLGALMVLFGLSIGSGIFVYLCAIAPNIWDEVVMSAVIVCAIVSFMTVLFVVAAGFSAMGLSDVKQALGLPEGSIRAMIALMLVMVFIIFGVYLFRLVSYGSNTALDDSDTTPNLQDFPNKNIVWSPFKDDNGKIRYHVWSITEADPDGKKLAQQLVTTVGTLVVAVSGFYFGSSTATSATRKGDGTTPDPKLSSITPDQAKTGMPLMFEVMGTGFDVPRLVKFIRGTEDMKCSVEGWNSARLQCKLEAPMRAGADKWDILVENADGKSARLYNVLTITG